MRKKRAKLVTSSLQSAKFHDGHSPHLEEHGAISSVFTGRMKRYPFNELAIESVIAKRRRSLERQAQHGPVVSLWCKAHQVMRAECGCEFDADLGKF